MEQLDILQRPLNQHSGKAINLGW